MDSATKSVLKMLAIGAVKKGLIGFGAFCGGHGVVLGFTATDYAAAAAGIVAAGWSFWQDAGKGIMVDSFEVMRARIHAQAEKIRSAGLPPVTAIEIAGHSEKLSVADVAKVIEVAK